MNSAQRSKWERTRSKGRKHFLIYNGVLGWGIPTAVIFIVLGVLLKNDYSGLLTSSFLKSVLTSLILFTACGYFWGAWVWKSNEKNYDSK